MKPQLEKKITPIEGLIWQTEEEIEDHVGTILTKLSQLTPINIIFKGDEPFTYGHYGVHLGQEDRLIFLGPSNSVITGYFIDCREGSISIHKRFITKFNPSSNQTLCIPAGVAHTFDTHGIFSINHYRISLP